MAILFSFKMNIPNFLTALRVILSFITAILLCLGFKYFATVAFVLFVVAGATDWFDGYLARKFNVVTVLGKFMDALCDKIMVIGMFMVLLGLNLYTDDWQKFAIFCTFFSSAREFFVSGIRMLAANTGVVLAAEKLGKYKAAFQMYSIGAIICAYSLRVDFNAEGIWFYQFAFYSGMLTLLISTVLSLISGVGYGIRYGYLLKS